MVFHSRSPGSHPINSIAVTLFSVTSYYISLLSFYLILYQFLSQCILYIDHYLTSYCLRQHDCVSNYVIRSYYLRCHFIILILHPVLSTNNTVVIIYNLVLYISGIIRITINLYLFVLLLYHYTSFITLLKLHMIYL